MDTRDYLKAKLEAERNYFNAMNNLSNLYAQNAIATGNAYSNFGNSIRKIDFRPDYEGMRFQNEMEDRKRKQLQEQQKNDYIKAINQHRTDDYSKEGDILRKKTATGLNDINTALGKAQYELQQAEKELGDPNKYNITYDNNGNITQVVYDDGTVLTGNSDKVARLNAANKNFVNITSKLQNKFDELMARNAGQDNQLEAAVSISDRAEFANNPYVQEQALKMRAALTEKKAKEDQLRKQEIGKLSDRINELLKEKDKLTEWKIRYSNRGSNSESNIKIPKELQTKIYEDSEELGDSAEETAKKYANSIRKIKNAMSGNYGQEENVNQYTMPREAELDQRIRELKRQIGLLGKDERLNKRIIREGENIIKYGNEKGKTVKPKIEPKIMKPKDGKKEEEKEEKEEKQITIEPNNKKINITKPAYLYNDEEKKYLNQERKTNILKKQKEKFGSLKAAKDYTNMIKKIYNKNTTIKDLQKIKERINKNTTLRKADKERLINGIESIKRNKYLNTLYKEIDRANSINELIKIRDKKNPNWVKGDYVQYIKNKLNQKYNELKRNNNIEYDKYYKDINIANSKDKLIRIRDELKKKAKNNNLLNILIDKIESRLQQLQ
jgi:hypothetical protein